MTTPRRSPAFYAAVLAFVGSLVGLLAGAATLAATGSGYRAAVAALVACIVVIVAANVVVWAGVVRRYRATRVIHMEPYVRSTVVTDEGDVFPALVEAGA